MKIWGIIAEILRMAEQNNQKNVGNNELKPTNHSVSDSLRCLLNDHAANSPPRNLQLQSLTVQTEIQDVIVYEIEKASLFKALGPAASCQTALVLFLLFQNEFCITYKSLFYCMHMLKSIVKA